MKRLSLLTLLILLILAGCTLIEDAITPFDKSQLYGNWVLIEDKLITSTERYKDTTYILSIDASTITEYDNEFKDFNQGSGPKEYSYSLKSDTLTFGLKTYKVDIDGDTLTYTELGGLSSFTRTFLLYEGAVPPEHW